MKKMNTEHEALLYCCKTLHKKYYHHIESTHITHIHITCCCFILGGSWLGTDTHVPALNGRGAGLVWYSLGINCQGSQRV